MKNKKNEKQRKGKQLIAIYLVIVAILLSSIFGLLLFFDLQGRDGPLDPYYEDRPANIEDNPFTTYWSDPRYITDLVIDSEANIAYIGCEYGVIAKDLSSGEHKGNHLFRRP